LRAAETACGINRAVTLLAERKAKGGGPARMVRGAEGLGAHPSPAPVKVMKGARALRQRRKLNAPCRGLDPGSITMESVLLTARGEGT
jgi:hypothetical protein